MKRNRKKRTMGIGQIIMLLTAILLASCSSAGTAQSTSGTVVAELPVQRFGGGGGNRRRGR